MAEIVANYFSTGWRVRVITCVCAWAGDTRSMRMELHETATDYACPECETTLLIVAHPDIDQVRAAAAEGNVEAQQQLALVQEALALHRNKPDEQDS